MLKQLGSNYVFTSDEDAEMRVSFDANARDRKRVLKNRRTRRELAVELKIDGTLEGEGCQCSHCRNDWDCCGRMVPGRVEIRARPGGLVAVQHYSRNI